MEASSEVQTTTPKTTTARSYECVFCKRGFSSAQALGGHMNIHRKDRRKPNHQPTSQPQEFPFNISSRVSPSLLGYAPQLIPKQPWIHDYGPQQLSLFVETPNRGDDRSSSSFAPVVEELDLELRLGPERPGHASMRLREFL